MRILKAVAAGIAGLLIILVPPYLLVRYIGNPYPAEGIHLAAPLTDHAILGLLAALVWVLWTQLTLSLLIELYAAVLDRPVDIRLPVFGFQQDLARVLVGAVIAATVATPLGAALFNSSAAASPDTYSDSGWDNGSNRGSGTGTGSDTADGLATTASRGTADATSVTAPGRQATRHNIPTAPDLSHLASEGAVAAGWRDSAPAGHVPAAPSTVREGSGAMPSATAGPGRIVTVTVSRGDTLWSLAETYLGDGARWTEIAAANQGHTMTDGTPFRSADQIHAGWRLAIPGLAETPDSFGAHRVDHYEVQAGDTLSEIARDMLGDPLAYPAIFAASQALTQPGGDTLTDPDHIEPGWTLAVPEGVEQPSGQPGDGATPGQPAEDQHLSSRTTGHTNADQVPSGRHRGQDGTAPSPNQHRFPDVEATPSPDAAGVTGRRLEVVPDVLEQGAAVTVPRALLASALCLSAGALGALVVNRRRQFRCRRIGRTIAATPVALREVEQAVIETGTQAQPDVEFLDRALRHVAASCRVTGDPLPWLGAAVLGDEDLTLLFTRPAAGTQPQGWTATDDARAWMLSRETFLEQDLQAQPAPYPALVSIGSDEGGRTWLLDLETVGMYGIGGEPDEVADVTRFLVAELAVNVWSEGTEVLLGDGLGAEIAGLNPWRVRPVKRQDALARAAAMAGEMDEVEENLRADLLTRRRDALLLDSTYPVVVVVASRPEDHDSFGADITSRERGRVVIVHREQERPAIELSRDGTAFLPKWGITVRAFTLSATEAATMAALVASTRNLQDEPVPASASDDGPLGKYARADGSLREEYTQSRRTDGNDLTSMLPEADEVYLEAAATTVEDLAAAAPSVPEPIRTEIAVLDPTLDGDVADWFDESSPRPKVHLLGPVAVTSLNGGDPQAIDNAGGTVSFIAYLAVQDHGVTGERAAAACGWKTQRTVQNRATNARFLLGTQPDGKDWLPDASTSTGARRGMTPTYELVRGAGGILNSADLFIRLKHRAQRRGDEGCEQDLVTALSLVTGAPFEAATEYRFKWLFTSEQRHDEILVGAIHDAAHVLATRGNAVGRTDLVTLACDAARRASPHSDIAWLDQAAATETQAGPDPAAATIREHILDQFDEDLPPRSEAVLNQRRWDATG